MIKRGIPHPLLGHVNLRFSATARNFTGRWTKGEPWITCPAGVPAARIVEVIDELAPRMLERRRTLSFEAGSVLELPGITIRFFDNDRSGRDTFVQGRPEGEIVEAKVFIGAELDEPERSQAVSSALTVLSRRYAAPLLLPRARALAAAAGLTVNRWKIGSGTKVLGTCERRSATISLSHIIVFLTQELRDLIVWHELAHLSGPGHDAAFHARVDRLSGGREAGLERRLRRYPWPILR